MTRKIDAEVGPRGTLELLSQREMQRLSVADTSAAQSDLFDMFRKCALAVLNTGNESDDAAAIFEEYSDFSIEIAKRTRGVKLLITNAPASAFVDGRIIEGVRQHLFAVLRDLLYLNTERFDLSSSEGITDSVFHLLNHARVLDPDRYPSLVVCWGGHSISGEEYKYTKEVGYHIGLRGLNICTGCGPGAMKGPMKGAAIGHAKQRIDNPRYIGLTEPSIIAAEPPNPIVSQLVTLPDIEKRLEAFVRMGHGIIVFPGGPGTTEEILYLLGILMDPANKEIKLPVTFTGPASSKKYFEQLDSTIRNILGDEATNHYTIVVGDAREVARNMAKNVKQVAHNRRKSGDAFYYNWLLHIPPAHQEPFTVTHESVAALRLDHKLPPHKLAVNLRRVFSAIVTGNVKEKGIAAVRTHGPFEIRGEPQIMEQLDLLLQGFVKDGRMKLRSQDYKPCYRVIPV